MFLLRKISSSFLFYYKIHTKRLKSLIAMVKFLPGFTMNQNFQEVVEDEDILWIIDIVDKTTVVIFSIEYSLRWEFYFLMHQLQFLLHRLLCSPVKTRFFIQPMNLIDFLSLLPFYISLAFIALEDFSDIGKAGKIIRLIKVRGVQG